MTTRGTQANKPEKVEIQRKRVTEEGLKLDLLVRWDISEITVEDEMSGETHNEWEYEQGTIKDTYEGRLADLDDYISNKTNFYLLQAREKANDLLLEEEKELIDYRTAEKINQQTHPATPFSETIAIIRDLLEFNINQGYIESTVEFDNYSQTAIDAIEEGQKLKEEL